VEEQIDFLVLRSCNKKLSYLSSEELGRIDNSHLAIAEKSPDLALDGRCLRLAELHSSAVDYVKTGEKVNVDKKLLAKDWPDYMEKQNKLQEFEGKTALGQMYRYVKEII
jgi:RNA-dependent RNA polymerase